MESASCSLGDLIPRSGVKPQHWQLGFSATGLPGKSLGEHFHRIASQSVFGAIAAFHACALIKVFSLSLFFNDLKRACSARLSKGEGGKNRKASEDGGQGQQVTDSRTRADLPLFTLPKGKN